ncbi:MAG: HEAT repeat domain-containing protein [Promethearchaeota archaeon]
MNPNENPYRIQRSLTRAPSSGPPVDFNNQRICPACGRLVKINHNFCKYCGVDLSEIKPIGNADEISKNLAISALTDPDPVIRKEAVDTLGSFKDTKALGVLTYIALHDPNEEVRKEAVDELGDIHHPYSLEALAITLKDKSAIVRKEAIEGLKKIKEKNKPEKMDDGKPEERQG